MQRIKFKTNYFLQLESKEKTLYVFEEAKNIWQQIIWRRIWKIIHKLYAAFDRPVPHQLHNADQYYAIASKQYVPQVYAGKVILFHAGERPPWNRYAPDMGWGELAAGGLEVYTISGRHRDLRDYRGETVFALTSKLNTILDEVSTSRESNH